MKFIILVSVALLAVAYAAEEVPILRNEQDINPDGSFQYSYETGDGVSAEAQGVLKNAGTDAEAEEVLGQYSYTAPDGTDISLKYVANENGFQPEGAHLPVGPEPVPIPDYIQRSLEYIRTHPQKEE